MNSSPLIFPHSAKAFVAVLLALFTCLPAFSMPAKGEAIKLTQPDGTTLTAYLRGDEHCHYYVNASGKMLTQDSNGFYRLATDEEVEHKLSQGEKRRSRANARRARRCKGQLGANNEVRQRRTIGISQKYEGEKNGIVILVNFLNMSMQPENDAAMFSRMFNEEGFSVSNNAGSVKEYFKDQSYGALTINFDVVGPVNLTKGYSYYGGNNSIGYDKHPAEMVIEACKAADKLGVDFSKYDWDSDGTVDQVYVVYAGRGENDGGTSSTIWPHEYSLTEAIEDGDGTGPITIDNVLIDTYAVSNELTMYSTLTGIGTACHEFSHCLGLPDFYDIKGSGGFGMNAWDLMDSGNYNGRTGRGESPVEFTAYERWFAGWMELRELNESCSVHDMPALADSPVAYAIYNEGNRNEYFVIENHQHGKWFQNIKNYDQKFSGLMVYHIDYDLEAWQNNEINTSAKHQRLSLIPADNSYGRYSSVMGSYNPTMFELSGDLFPGAGNVTALTNESHSATNGTLFNANTDGSFLMNKPITNITETDGLISFDFMGGGVDASIKGIEYSNAYETEYYNINGTRVYPPLDKGVYITRNNGFTKKIIIR